MAEQPRLSLHDGNSIPQLGLGVWQVPAEITARVVADGIRAGYRSIDTAQGYRNEEGVGEAIRTAGVPREELFITSKLRNGAHDRDAALQSFDESMRKLGIEQLDLFLIHWPLPVTNKFVETWNGLIAARNAGLTRSIGVSNFTTEYLTRLIDETGEAPVINQIELHPYFQQRELRDFHAARGIATEAWSPLGQGGELLADPVLARIAEAHDATPAQVVIAWHLAIGNVVIPKSVTPSRIAENFAAATVELTDGELADIAALDRSDGRMGPDPVTIGEPW